MILFVENADVDDKIFEKRLCQVRNGTGIIDAIPVTRARISLDHI